MGSILLAILVVATQASAEGVQCGQPTLGSRYVMPPDTEPPTPGREFERKMWVYTGDRWENYHMKFPAQSEVENLGESFASEPAIQDCISLCQSVQQAGYCNWLKITQVNFTFRVCTFTYNVKNVEITNQPFEPSEVLNYNDSGSALCSPSEQSAGGGAEQVRGMPMPPVDGSF